jgi:hypothetical protein
MLFGSVWFVSLYGRGICHTFYDASKNIFYGYQASPSKVDLYLYYNLDLLTILFCIAILGIDLLKLPGDSICNVLNILSLLQSQLLTLIIIEGYA